MGQGTVEIKTRGTRGLDRNFSCQARFEFFDHTTAAFLAAPTVLGVIDTHGIALLHPLREGRTP